LSTKCTKEHEGGRWVCLVKKTGGFEGGNGDFEVLEAFLIGIGGFVFGESAVEMKGEDCGSIFRSWDIVGHFGTSR
jgi:hypothetical protein